MKKYPIRINENLNDQKKASEIELMNEKKECSSELSALQSGSEKSLSEKVNEISRVHEESMKSLKLNHENLISDLKSDAAETLNVCLQKSKDIQHDANVELAACEKAALDVKEDSEKSLQSCERAATNAANVAQKQLEKEMEIQHATNLLLDANMKKTTNLQNDLDSTKIRLNNELKKASDFRTSALRERAYLMNQLKTTSDQLLKTESKLKDEMLSMGNMKIALGIFGFFYLASKRRETDEDSDDDSSEDDE